MRILYKDAHNERPSGFMTNLNSDSHSDTLQKSANIIAPTISHTAAISPSKASSNNAQDNTKYAGIDFSGFILKRKVFVLCLIQILFNTFFYESINLNFFDILFNLVEDTCLI